MKKIILVAFAIMLSQFMAGCSVYPIQKDNVLAGRTVTCKSKFNSDYPMEVSLPKNKNDFINEAKKGVDAFLIDEPAKIYANNSINDYTATLTFPYATSVKDLDLGEEINKYLMNESIRLLNKTIENNFNHRINKIVYSDLNTTLIKTLSTLPDKSVAFITDPSKENLFVTISPVNLKYQINRLGGGNKEADYSVNVEIPSQIIYQYYGLSNRYSSVANISLKAHIAIKDSELTITIGDVSYAINSHQPESVTRFC